MIISFLNDNIILDGTSFHPEGEHQTAVFPLPIERSVQLWGVGMGGTVIY